MAPDGSVTVSIAGASLFDTVKGELVAEVPCFVSVGVIRISMPATSRQVVSASESHTKACDAPPADVDRPVVPSPPVPSVQGANGPEDPSRHATEREDLPGSWEVISCNRAATLRSIRRELEGL